MIYYGLLFYTITIYFFIKYKFKFEKFIWILWFIPMWLLMGMRWGVGADFFSYKYIFDNAGKNIFIQFDYIEKGFLVLNWIVHKFTSDSVCLFLICAFIIIFLFLKEIQCSSSDCLMSVILFISLGYYFNSMNVMRQFIAVGISFYSIKYFKTKEWYKYLILIIIASLFHKTVLILVPVYFMIIFLHDRLFYLVTFVCFALISLFSSELFSGLAQRSLYFSKLMVNSTTQQRISLPNIVLGIVVFIACIIIYKDNNMNVYTKYTWLAVLSFIFLNKYGTAATRIGFYFTPVYILAIPDVIHSMKDRRSKLIAYLTVIFICFIYLNIILQTSVETGNNFIPYNSILDK